MKTAGKRVVSVILTLVMVIGVAGFNSNMITRDFFGIKASAYDISFEDTAYWPVPSSRKINQRFSSSHKGLDIGGSIGVPVIASKSGRVVAAQPTWCNHETEGTSHNCVGTDLGTYGNYVEIKNNDGTTSRYGHMKYNTICVSVGQQVSAGQQIGCLGSSGSSSGPHLHFEIYNGSYSNRGDQVINPSQATVNRLGLTGDIVNSSREYYLYNEPTPTYHNPQGVVDFIEGRTGCVWVRGWVFDLDAPHISTDIHVYIGGDSSSGEGHVFNACVSRPDVDSVYKVGEYHGYDCLVYTNLSGTLPVYIYGINLEGGNNVLLGSGTVTITPDTIAPTVTEYGIIETTQDGFTVYCYFDDNVGVTRVQFPTWTPWQGGNNGQDDLIWYEGNFNPDGKSAWARISISNHNNELGAYATHIYVWDAAGNCSQYAMGITVERDAPVISNVVISDITTTGYTVTCTVTDENSLNRVQFPSWHTWDDLIWLNGSISGSSASCRINVSDFANATGYYTTHIYAYDIWGNVGSINAGTFYVPSESERHTISYSANGGTGAPSSQSGYVNPSMNIVISKTIPTKAGYTFAGWNTQADGLGTSYAPGTSYTTEADVTLYAQWLPNTPVVNPTTGSGVVVDESTRFIYGLSAGATQGFVAVTDGTAAYEYPTAKQAMGTGTKVNVYNNDNVLVDSYTIVVFGDIDGDSWYDGTDAYFVRLVANGLIARSALTDAQRMAADCNHDGLIDSADVAILEQAGLLLNQIDQNLPSEEPKTNSVYLDYCSLIDQSIEIVEPEAEQSATDEEPAQPAAQNLFSRMMAIFTAILNRLLGIFKIA